MENRIMFRAGVNLLKALQERNSNDDGSLSQTAKRDLSRYYALLDSISIDLTEAEFNLLCDLCNGTMFGEFELSPAKCLVAELLSGGKALASKWGGHYNQLLAKAQNWNNLEGAFVVDSIERFWRAKCTECQ